MAALLVQRNNHSKDHIRAISGMMDKHNTFTLTLNNVACKGTMKHSKYLRSALETRRFENTTVTCFMVVKLNVKPKWLNPDIFLNRSFFKGQPTQLSRLTGSTVYVEVDWHVEK